MRRFYFSLITTLLAFCFGVECLANPAGQKSAEAEEYSVYTFLINQRFSNQQVKSIVIADRTLDLQTDRVMQSQLSYIQQNAPDIPRKMAADFENKNRQPYSLSGYPATTGNTFLASGEALRKLFQDGGGWSAFYERYPGPSGIISFSSVAFNSKRDQALVYVSWSCGDRCAERGFMLLKKKKGAWTSQRVGMNLVS